MKLLFGGNMTINAHYKLPSSDTSSSDYEKNAGDGDFVIDSNSTPDKSAKQKNKRNYQARRAIERLKEERRLKKLIDDDYDDWD
jgi:hypothetical protein